MVAPSNVRYSPTRFPLHSLHVGCTSSRVECRWRTPAGTPDRVVGLLLVRICEYISDHNRLMPESVPKRFVDLIFQPDPLCSVGRTALTYFHIRAAFEDKVLSALAAAARELSVVH